MSNPPTLNATDGPIEIKRHAACDECRARKLKCSGTTPKCSRCEREGGRCEYSPQKQMGRPKKRRREDDDVDQQMSPPNEGSPQTSPPAITMNDLAIAHEVGFEDFTGLNGMLQCEQGHQHPINIDPALSNGYNNPYPTPHMQSWSGFTAPDTVQQSVTDQPAHSPHCTPDTNNTASTPQTYHSHSSPPNLNPSPSSNTNSCACLSHMYLSLSTLSSLGTHSFPHVLSPIRSALAVVDTVVDCPLCPLDTSTIIQNIGVLQTHLTTIANTFFKALAAIDAEAAHLVETNTTRPYRIGDSSPAAATLHNATHDCPASFTIELSGDEWRKLARRALQAEAGTCGGRPHERTFVGLVERMVERQNRWHRDAHAGMCSHLYVKKGEENAGATGVPGPGGKIEEHECVKTLMRVLNMVNLMGFEE